LPIQNLCIKINFSGKIYGGNRSGDNERYKPKKKLNCLELLWQLDMQLRDSVQILWFLQTHKLHFVLSKMTRRASPYENGLVLGGSKIYSRKTLPLRLSTDRYLDIDVYLETKQPAIGKNRGLWCRLLVKT
jgi:hypothetical protein